jgi:hypothetical protein
MFSMMRQRVSVAGLIATLALVFAMTGGAFAAKKYLITSASQIKPSVRKALKGPRGLPGATGPAGPTGPRGATGPGGPTGPEGKKGDAGNPWTAGGTLPPGATETGVWGYTLPAEAEDIVSISFPIPLAAAIPIEPTSNIHIIETPEEDLTDCPGTADQPAAAPGQLCLFAFFPPAGTLGTVTFSKVSGVLLSVQAGEGSAFGAGTWAVKAPTT